MDFAFCKLSKCFACESEIHVIIIHYIIVRTQVENNKVETEAWYWNDIGVGFRLKLSIRYVLHENLYFTLKKKKISTSYIIRHDEYR